MFIVLHTFTILEESLFSEIIKSCADWNISQPEGEQYRHKVCKDGRQLVVVVEHERVPVDGHRH